MLKILGLDLESSTGGKVFGPDPKDPTNDFYSLIVGTTPTQVDVYHKEMGYKRILNYDLTTIDLIVCHNAAFDISYIWENTGFQEFIKRGGSIWCTAQAEYALTGQRHKFPSLAELQLKRLGIKTKETRISKLFKAGIGAQSIIKAKDRCKRVWKLYNHYCKDDVSSMLKIFAIQYREAKERGMLNVCKLHMKALLGVISMQKTGMHLDTTLCEKRLQELKIKAVECLKEATDIIKPLWDERLGEFKINSPKHKSAILFGGWVTYKVKEQCGWTKGTPLFRTKLELVEYYDEENDNYYTVLEKVREISGYKVEPKPKYKTIEKSLYIEGFELPRDLTDESKVEGRYVTDVGVINKIYKYSSNKLAVEYCKKQKEAMNYQKICSTYLEAFLKYQINGVLYPKYNTTLTVTSRLSSSQPNFQNMPASGEMFEVIQGCLAAPDDSVCVSIDFSQLEPYTTALITGDKNLTNDLLNGVCLHCRAVSWVPSMSEGKTYEEIYQLAVVEKDPKWVLKRKKAKGINFKRAYGGGAKSLAEAEDLLVEDVQAVFDGQKEAYPRVEQFYENLYENLKNNERVSRESDFANRDRAGRVFDRGLELLPIFTQGKDKPEYKTGEYRHYGTYTTRFGAMFCFEEVGRWDKYGKLKRGYSTTETRNYWVQGSAGNIVEMAIAECFDYTLQNPDVKMVRQIHDEIGFYVKKDTMHLTIPKLCSIMEDVISNTKKYFKQDVDFNFKTEAKSGKTFADLEVYDGQQRGSECVIRATQA